MSTDGSERYIFLSGQDGNATFSNNNSTLAWQFPSAFRPDDEQVALLDGYIYYSWFNVNNQVYNNNSFSYIYNVATFNVVLPNGYYAVSDLNYYLQQYMHSQNHYSTTGTGSTATGPFTTNYYLQFVANPTYYCVTLTATLIPGSAPANTVGAAGFVWTNNTMQVVFNSNNFSQLVGFPPSTTWPATPQTSTYSVNGPDTPEITPIDSVKINLNMAKISGSYNNTISTIYQFSSSDLTFGSQIQLSPMILRWCNMYNQPFQSLVISFTDQNGIPLWVNDVAMNFTLVVRKRPTSTRDLLTQGITSLGALLSKGK